MIYTSLPAASNSFFRQCFQLNLLPQLEEIFDKKACRALNRINARDQVTRYHERPQALTMQIIELFDLDIITRIDKGFYEVHLIARVLELCVVGVSC